MENKNIKKSKEVSSAKKQGFIRKVSRTIATANMLIATTLLSIQSVSAAPATPEGVDTTAYNSIINIVFWIVCIAIGAGCLPSIQNISQGVQDNDPRQRNQGILGVAVGAACIGAAAAVKTAIL